MLFEAYAARLPVVATAVGSVAAFAGDAALLAEPGDPAAPVAHLRRLAADPALRTAMIEAGLGLVRGHTIEREQARAAAFLAGDATPA